MIRHASDRTQECIKEKCFLRKLALCKLYLSSQKYGPLLENEIRTIFHLTRPLNAISGDGLTSTGLQIEIKVSFVNKGRFNLVQLRPFHRIDYYIIMLYDYTKGEQGEYYWLLIPGGDINDIICEYGNYAHGSITSNGPITRERIGLNPYEYCLRPNYNVKPSSKGFKLWQRLMSYRTTAYLITKTLQNKV